MDSVVTCTHEASLAAGAQTHVDLTTGVVGSDSKITNNVVINPGSGGKDVPASGTVERPSGGGGDDGGGGDTPARTGAGRLAEMLLWACCSPVWDSGWSVPPAVAVDAGVEPDAAGCGPALFARPNPKRRGRSPLSVRSWIQEQESSERRWPTQERARW